MATFEIFKTNLMLGQGTSFNKIGGIYIYIYIKPNLVRIDIIKEN